MKGSWAKQLFVDAMMTMLCDDVEEQIRNFEADTDVSSVKKDVQKELTELQWMGAELYKIYNGPQYNHNIVDD